MWIRQILVAVVGLASGFAVAAGLFSFIIGLGVVSDFADRTHTGKHVMLYENCIMAGGILGNIFWVWGSRCLAANGSFRCLDFFPEFLLVAGQWHLRKS